MNVDLLQNFAEVATGFTGFSGVVVALTMRQREAWNTYASNMIWVLLAASLGVVFFSFLPRVLAELPPMQHVADLVAAATLVVYHIGFAVWGNHIDNKSRIRGYAYAPPKLAFVVAPIGLGILGFQVAGLTPQLRSWLPFSYTLTLLFLLSIAVLSFVVLLVPQKPDTA